MKTKKTATPSERTSRIFYLITLISFAAALVYVPVRAALDSYYRESTELHLIVFQTLFGLVIINLPIFLRERFSWKIPGSLSAAYTLFLYASIFLGEVMTFYYRIPLWDDLLHLCSSILLGIFGFSVVEMLTGGKDPPINLPPFFIALFAASFAVAVGVLWEIYEFSFDGLLGLNMQKFAVADPTGGQPLTELCGREALMDTMTDLIIDTVGAVGICTAGYVSLKRKGKFISALKVTLKRQEKSENNNNRKGHS